MQRRKSFPAKTSGTYIEILMLVVLHFFVGQMFSQLVHREEYNPEKVTSKWHHEVVRYLLS